MARRTIFKDEKYQNWMGEFPHDIDVGFVGGQSGIRRKLCSDSDLIGLNDQQKAMKLTALYNTKASEYENRNKIQELEENKKTRRFKGASELWLNEIKATKKEKTWASYKLTIELYLKFVGDHPFKDFGRKKNIIFLQELKTHKKPIYNENTVVQCISLSTQNMHMRQLQVFINWAYDMEYLKKRYYLTKAIPPQKDMEVYSLQDVEKVHDYLTKKIGEVINPRSDRFNRNLYRAYMLARHTLVRSGHIWSLKLENIDLEKGVIRFTENTDLNWQPKAMKWPTKPLNKTLLNFLKDDLKNRDKSELYFLDNGNGGPWYATTQGLSNAMRKIANKLGLPKSVKPFHGGFRAAGITYLLENGASPVKVQQLADHSDLATTMKYYNTRKSSQKDIVDLLG